MTKDSARAIAARENGKLGGRPAPAGAKKQVSGRILPDEYKAFKEHYQAQGIKESQAVELAIKEFNERRK